MKKIWINENQFIDIDGPQEGEFAPRSRALDWFGTISYLPDPDPILRNLGEDLSTYRSLLSDAHVWSCYESRTAAVLNREWEVAQPDRGEASPAIMDAVDEMLRALPMHQILTDILDAPFFGMAPLEVMWGRDGRRWFPENIVGKPTEWFRFDEHNQLLFLSAESPMGEPVPEGKFLLPRHHPSYTNPYGERVLSRCFWPVAFKRGGWKFWAIFTEKFGMPWTVGKVPRGASSTDRATMLSNLANMVQDAVAVINDDESVVLQEAAGKSGSADIYDRLIKTSNAEISKAVLGQTLSTELPDGGSYAASQSHMEIRGEISSKDRLLAMTTMNRLIDWFLSLNHPGETPPVFKFYEEEDVQVERSARDKTLSEQGVRFTKKYYGATYDLEDDDFEIAAPTPPQPGQRPEENNGLFAEEADIPTREDSDAIADEAAARSAEQMAAMLQPVLRMIDEASSLEEIGEKLFGLYPDLDPTAFQDLLATAIAAAGAVGYGSAQMEKP